MSAIGNLIWFLFGGVLMGLFWWLMGVLACVSIVGMPWGKACFVMGRFAFLPFGREAISRSELTLKRDVGSGAWGTLGNVIWFVLAGLWLAIGHILAALLAFITVVGIPFGVQHLKLAGIALAPIGKTIVPKEVAVAARKTNAEAAVAAMRGST